MVSKLGRTFISVLLSIATVHCARADGFYFFGYQLGQWKSALLAQIEAARSAQLASMENRVRAEAKLGPNVSLPGAQKARLAEESLRLEDLFDKVRQEVEKKLAGVEKAWPAPNDKALAHWIDSVESQAASEINRRLTGDPNPTIETLRSRIGSVFELREWVDAERMRARELDQKWKAERLALDPGIQSIVDDYRSEVLQAFKVRMAELERSNGTLEDRKIALENLLSFQIWMREKQAELESVRDHVPHFDSEEAFDTYLERESQQLRRDAIEYWKIEDDPAHRGRQGFLLQDIQSRWERIQLAAQQMERTRNIPEYEHKKERITARDKKAKRRLRQRAFDQSMVPAVIVAPFGMLCGLVIAGPSFFHHGAWIGGISGVGLVAITAIAQLWSNYNNAKARLSRKLSHLSLDSCVKPVGREELRAKVTRKARLNQSCLSDSISAMLQGVVSRHCEGMRLGEQILRQEFAGGADPKLSALRVRVRTGNEPADPLAAITDAEVRQAAEEEIFMQQAKREVEHVLAEHPECKRR